MFSNGSQKLKKQIKQNVLKSLLKQMLLAEYFKKIDSNFDKIFSRLDALEYRLDRIEQRMDTFSPNEREEMVVVYRRPREDYRGYLLCKDKYEEIVKRSGNNRSEFYDLCDAHCLETDSFSSMKDLTDHFKNNYKVVKWCFFSMDTHQLVEFPNPQSIK